MVLQNESKSIKGLVPVHDGGNGDSIETDSIMDSNVNGPSDAGHHSTTGGGSSGGGGGSIATSNGGTVERMSHEQPVIKRQRIEHDRGNSTDAGGGGTVGAGNTHQHGQGSLGNSPETRANGMATTSTTPASSSGNSSNASSACSSSTSLSSSPSCSSTKLVPSSLDHSSDDEQQQHSIAKPLVHGSNVTHPEHPAEDYHAAFQEAIGRQCLCTIDSSVLVLSFKAHRSTYNHAAVQSDGIADSAPPPLSEWPFEHLLKFLSNVQLLFDTYLKQNIKGNICAGVMELCNYLIRSDDHPHLQHPHLRLYRVNSPTFAGFPALDIDELIGLCSCNNKYVSYLAGRILSSFLIIVKDDPDDDRWLEKIVANLFDFGHLDLHAVRKINASLEVIKRIVEWKDETEHPLEEEAAGGASGGGGGTGGPAEWSSPGGGSSSGNVGVVAAGAPSLADNYFATHYASHQYANDDGASRNIFHPAGGMSGESSSTSSPSSSGTALASATKASEPPAASSHPGTHSTNHPLLAGGEGTGPCRYITLTDSESFDTTRIKFETINILGGKWSALVKHISSLIRAQANSTNPAVMVATETCILTFLRLWESIISVKANLSVVETQPFHSQLDSFQLLLLVTKNAVIYRQMLTLFNEALCYGSTLALQDLIPEEVGSLAHNIVRSVKDYRILDKMPKSSYSNHLGFLGYQGEIVRYQNRRLARLHDQTTGSGSVPSQQPTVVATPETCYDRTLLQKMALLVLKAVAVIVKEIRCDSSDSSVDSSDFDMQEIQMIERSIRDVVKKLETFLKAQLEFHPESHFSKVLIHLFDDQDDYLVEAMVCTLDVTSGISFRNNAFPELIAMLNPVYTFIEFSNLGPNITHLFLDLLISPETCFLLFLLRFLKYIRQNWAMFTQSCYNYYRHNSYSNAATLLQHRLRAATGSSAGLVSGANVANASSHGGDHSNAAVAGGTNANVILDSVMTVLISLRLQISRLVADTLFPYNITPILRLIENCESLYEGNELS
ncbi:protein lines [Anopheles funestus]|uniref:protein lines n=1 Tax=Anopheles funestus TaxID=62324 RepID=UPI0020C5D2A7|nr:protein lines [Anopheles funestus]XP_049300022.1 protein lines [Anopheles funestus]